MVMVQTEEQWRVYAAEASVPFSERFASSDEADTYLWYVQQTAWWREYFPEVPRIALEHGSYDNRGTPHSFARPLDALDGPWRISLHVDMQWPLVLLHEVAHVLNATEFGDLRRVQSGRERGHRRDDHGEMFRAALCALAERFTRDGAADGLRAAFAHYELEVPALAELVTARAHQAEMLEARRTRVAEDERQWHQSQDPLIVRARELEEARRVARLQGEAPPLRIPTIGWGEWIESVRRRPTPMVSQRSLAGIVNQVTPCSARMISMLERSEDAPQRVEHRRVALACAALFDLDPVYMWTALDLVPSPELLTLEQLDVVAPDWTAHVRHLDALHESRPNARGGVRID